MKIQKFKKHTTAQYPADLFPRTIYRSPSGSREAHVRELGASQIQVVLFNTGMTSSHDSSAVVFEGRLDAAKTFLKTTFGINYR